MGEREEGRERGKEGGREREGERERGEREECCACRNEW